jgi:hypothetical protein
MAVAITSLLHGSCILMSFYNKELLNATKQSTCV